MWHAMLRRSKAVWFHHSASKATRALRLLILLLAVCLTNSPTAALAEVTAEKRDTGPQDLRPVHPAHARAAARRLADHALRLNDPEMIIAALIVLLQTGASLDPNDPWETPQIFESALAMTKDTQHRHILERLRARGFRGVTYGTQKENFPIPPDKPLSVPYGISPNGRTHFEVTLLKASIGADIDLQLLAEDGTVLARNIGPERGVDGVPAEIMFQPRSCIDAVLEITNKDSVDAWVRVIATSEDDPSICDGAVK